MDQGVLGKTTGVRDCGVQTIVIDRGSAGDGETAADK